MTRDEILNALDAAGLEHKRDEIAALLQPALHLTTVPTVDADLPVGVSKMGGEPDLPPSTPWPHWSENTNSKPIPLRFLAQINLAEIAWYPATLFPPSGLLSFFYNTDDLQWNRKNEGDYRVLYTPGSAALERCRVPDALHALAELPAAFNPCAIQFSSEIPLRPLWKVCHTNTERAALREVADQDENADRSYGGDHQMLGRASYIWEDVTFELALNEMGHNHYTIKGEPAGSPLRREIAERASKWLLLLQLDSDAEEEGKPGWCWGLDPGTLYFHIHESDLAELRFNGVQMQVQTP